MNKFFVGRCIGLCALAFSTWAQAQDGGATLDTSIPVAHPRVDTSPTSIVARKGYEPSTIPVGNPRKIEVGPDECPLFETPSLTAPRLACIVAAPVSTACESPDLLDDLKNNVGKTLTLDDTAFTLIAAHSHIRLGVIFGMRMESCAQGDRIASFNIEGESAEQDPMSSGKMVDTVRLVVKSPRLFDVFYRTHRKKEFFRLRVVVNAQGGVAAMSGTLGKNRKTISNHWLVRTDETFNDLSSIERDLEANPSEQNRAFWQEVQEALPYYFGNRSFWFEQFGRNWGRGQ